MYAFRRLHNIVCSSVRSGSVWVNSGNGVPGPNATCLQPEICRNTIVRSEHFGYIEGLKTKLSCQLFLVDQILGEEKTNMIPVPILKKKITKNKRISKICWAKSVRNQNRQALGAGNVEQLHFTLSWTEIQKVPSEH